MKTISKQINELSIGDQVRFHGVTMIVTGNPINWGERGWGNPKDPKRNDIYTVPCKISEYSKKNETPINSIRGLLYTYDKFQGISEVKYDVICDEDKILED